MNPDIRIEISFRGHRKRGKLQALLGPKSTDYLIDLWIGCALSRPEGILHGYDPLDIAIEAGWNGDPQEFVDALVKVGFLDILDNGTYALHDWEEHQPFVVKTKEREEHARKASNARWGRRRSQAEAAQGMVKSSSRNAQPMLGASSENARGNPPIPIPVVSNTSKVDKSVSILCASPMPEEPQTAPEVPTFSAPDGAGSANSLTVNGALIPLEGIPVPDADSRTDTGRPLDEGEKRVSRCSRASPTDAAMSTLQDGPADLQNSSFVQNLKIHQVIQPSLNPPHPKSAINSNSRNLKPQVGECRSEGSMQQKHSSRPPASAVSWRETTDEPLFESQSQKITLATEAPLSHSEKEPLFYLTKRRRRLTGWKLETFEDFWETFNLRKGKAEAADAWLEISDLTPELARKIIQAADREAEARALLIAKGRTPKWAQGWISARRWEDWEDDRAATFNHDHAHTREATHDARGSRTQEDEDAEYYRSIREAVKRFM